MLATLGGLLLLAAVGWGVRAAAGALHRPVPTAALAAFLLLSVLPYPRTFVTNTTPLPLDHVLFLQPWSVLGHGLPHNPHLNDVATQILPWTEAIRLAWKEGSWPWRDAWNGCGTPLAANSLSAAFSPLTFAVILFPLWRGFALAIAIKLFVAATGMWLWARELRISAASSAFAAVGFALSFSFLPPWIFFPQTGVFCLWPWMLFLVERCRDVLGRRRAVAALGIVFVLIVLAGHPESAALGALFAGIFLVGRWWIGDLPDFPKVASAIAISAAVAVGLTSFLLLPSILAIAASGRLAAVAGPWQKLHLSLVPHAPFWRGALPQFFPYTFGNAIQSPSLVGGTSSFPEMTLGYAGILTWMLALLVFRRGSNRPRAERMLWMVALVGMAETILLWPVPEIVVALPVVRYVSPLRFGSWMTLALPVIAAFELDRYLRDLREGRTRAGSVVVAAAALGTFGAALYAGFLTARRTDPAGLRFQTWQLALVLAILGLACALALARPRLLAPGLAVLCGLELLCHWRAVNHRYPSDWFFPNVPMLDFLRTQRGVFRVAGKGTFLFPSTSVFARLEDVRTHDAVERYDYLQFLDRTCGYPHDEYFKALRNLDAPALDFLNVRYVLAEAGSAAPGPRWHEVYAGRDGIVFENGRVLGRAFAPRRIRLVLEAPRRGVGPTLDAARAFGPAFSEVTAASDWADMAWVLGAVAGETPNPPVEISDYAETTNAASFATRVPGADPAYVVVSLVQDGGWVARDESGEALSTSLANGPFLAVRIPAKTSRVLLTYRPPGLRVGIAVSALTLVVLVALTRRTKRKGSPAAAP